MAVSCAWRMVSNLNVNPFQALNSPLVEPVSIRRPSGVHWEQHQAGKRLTIHEHNARTVTAFTGHRILFVDVWMNVVQGDVEALSGVRVGLWR